MAIRNKPFEEDLASFGLRGARVEWADAGRYNVSIKRDDLSKLICLARMSSREDYITKKQADLNATKMHVLGERMGKMIATQDLKAAIDHLLNNKLGEI